MGACDSEANYRINEVEIKKSKLKELDKNIIKVSPSVCKISTNESNGTGFLIRLNKQNREIFCLMTNEHVITKEMVQREEKIEVSYDCESQKVQIDLNTKNRLIQDFKNINIDITIVEILPKDKIEQHYFLYPELNNVKNIVEHNIYIPQFPQGMNFCYSQGKIKKINDVEITHDATTRFGASGSPIFLENSIKVIAIHKQGNIKKTENYGNFLFPILQSLQTVNVNYISNDKKQEYQKYFFADGSYYVGPLTNGLPNGKGKLYTPKGILHYEGDFVNGIKEGNGKEIYESGNYYIGQFSNNKRNGKGKFYFKSGDFYEGDFVNNLREGYGKNIFKDGDYYIGYYLKDKRHGKGKQFYKNGTLLSDIDFFNDKFEGYGRYNYEDGEYYIGQWHNCLKHGKGKIYYKNGNIKFDGNFINDKKEGYGEYYWEDGLYYKGNFHNDLFNGKGKEYYKNGNIKCEGDYVNNYFEGYGRFNYVNGEYYIGQWSQGKKHGKGTLYNQNGTMKQEGFFFNGNFEG